MLNPKLILEVQNIEYINPDLTFSELKEILRSCSECSLESEQKTSGQEILLSFSVKNGRIKVIDNKSEIKSGGQTPEKFVVKLGDLKDTTLNILKSLERSVHSLSHEQQTSIFGDDANIFYSIILLSSGDSPNNYDSKNIIINNSGHLKNGEESSVDTKDLQNLLDVSQEKLKNDKYAAQASAISDLNSLCNKHSLNTVFSKLNTLLSNVRSVADLSDESTIGEYLTARVVLIINSILDKNKIKNMDPVVKKNITKNILGIKGISVADIYKKASKEELEKIKTNLTNDITRKEILQTAIVPLYRLIGDYSAEMLNHLHSIFIILGQEQSSIKDAVDNIHSSSNDELMNNLRRELFKLKSLENNKLLSNGFTFEYDGKKNNFSAGFKPVSKLIQLLKTSQMKKLDESKDKNIKETVAIFPGSFKPPHKGHLAAAKAYSKMADKVIVMVSPLSKEMSDGTQVTSEISKNIWNMYLESEGLSDKISVIDSPYSSPNRAAYEFISNKSNDPNYAQPGQNIIIGSSNKNDDDKQFSDIASYIREGCYAEAKPVKSMGRFGSSDMREAICKRNKEQIKKYLPESMNKNKACSQIMEMFWPTQKVSESIIRDIINEQVIKVKYSLLKKKINKENNVSGGNVQGFGQRLVTKPE